MAEFHRLRAIQTDECVIWPHHTNRAGYGQISIYDPSLKRVRTTVRCHRLALLLASCGVAPEGKHAAHGPCNNRRCMNVRHLSWRTPMENAADRERDGTVPRGPRAEWLAKRRAA